MSKGLVQSAVTEARATVLYGGERTFAEARATEAERLLCEMRQRAEAAEEDGLLVPLPWAAEGLGTLPSGKIQSPTMVRAAA